MRKRWSRFVWDERGSQLLEFVLVFPLVWILFVFTFDQFTVLYNRQKALEAAYEAGRIAAVQPNFGLAQYHARERGEAELEQGIGTTWGEVRLSLQGGTWKKGNHVEARATIAFRLLASGTPQEVTESYHVMIENAEEGR